MRPNLNRVQVNLWPLGVLLLAAALALAVIACGGDEGAPTAPAAGTAGQTTGETPQAAAGTAGQTAGETPQAASQTSSGQASAPANTPLPTVDAARISELQGDINIDGSSTVFPITEAMAEEFGKATGGTSRSPWACPAPAGVSRSSAPVRPSSPTRPAPSSRVKWTCALRTASSI